MALAVHQAARVADSGHGGQVIVSAQTAAHLQLPSIEPFHLADLGEYRLRSFDEACHLFQLAGPGLAGAFPPLRTRAAVSRRVRIFLSSPGDLRAAREIAALTVERLAQDYARFFTVEAYFWDHEAMLASGHFQDPIEPPSVFDWMAEAWRLTRKDPNPNHNRFISTAACARPKFASVFGVSI